MKNDENELNELFITGLFTFFTEASKEVYGPREPQLTNSFNKSVPPSSTLLVSQLAI
jgi:hypothetical protein